MTKIGRPSLWEEHRDEWVRLYCEEKWSRGQIAREYETSVPSVTRQLIAAGVDLEPRVGINPNAGRSPERQAEINAKVSAARKGKGVGPRVERSLRTCQNPKCTQEYEYVPGKTGEKYCSKSCQMSTQGQRSAAQARAEYDQNPRRCPCGEAIPYEYRYSRVHCSPEHAKQYQTKRQSDLTKHVTFTCQNETCGKTVTRPRTWGKGYFKYCSNNCARKHTKTTRHFAVDGVTVLDSAWEVYVWGKLSYLKVPIERYDREKGVPWNGTGWYAPDLWLPLYSLAVEVKGQSDTEDPAKWELFRSERGPLVVIDDKVMKHFHEVSDRGDLMELLTSFAAAQAVESVPSPSK